MDHLRLFDDKFTLRQAKLVCKSWIHPSAISYFMMSPSTRYDAVFCGFLVEEITNILTTICSAGLRSTTLIGHTLGRFKGISSIESVMTRSDLTVSASSVLLICEYPGSNNEGNTYAAYNQLPDLFKSYMPLLYGQGRLWFRMVDYNQMPSYARYSYEKAAAWLGLVLIVTQWLYWPKSLIGWHGQRWFNFDLYPGQILYTHCLLNLQQIWQGSPDTSVQSLKVKIFSSTI